MATSPRFAKLGNTLLYAAGVMVGWYAHNKYHGIDSDLERSIWRAGKEKMSALVIEPRKLKKPTPQVKTAVVNQLKREEWERLRTGGLKENCKSTILVRFGRWEVVEAGEESENGGSSEKGRDGDES